LEALGRGLAAAKDGRVQAGFVDDQQLLITPKGTHNVRTLFIIIERSNHIARHTVFKGLSHISRYPPRLALHQHQPNGGAIERKLHRQAHCLASSMPFTEALTSAWTLSSK